MTIDAYLWEISPESSSITEVIEVVAGVVGVSISTVNRWRAADCVPKADEVVGIIVAINRKRPEGKKCTIRDVAILCNYKNSFRNKEAKPADNGGEK